MSHPVAKRVAFFGSPPFATRCFEHLCTTRLRPQLLVTQPDKEQGRGRKVVSSPLVDAAEREGVERLACANAADPDFLAELRRRDLDWIVVVSFGQILKRAFLDLPRDGVLNVHASLLPRWRGASPIAAAIRAGDAVSGLSLQRVVPKLDAGAVCARLEVPIPERITAGEFQQRLSELAGPFLAGALELLSSGDAVFEEQDPTQVTLAPKISKSDGVVAWSEEAAIIDRHVRAMTPWPGATTRLPVRETHCDVRILRGAPLAVTSAAEPGTVVAADESGISVACGGPHVYRIEVLQASNGKPLEAAAFLRGRPVSVGSLASAPVLG